MKLVIQNVMAVFWGAIFGVVVGYIAGQLESATTNFTTAAILGGVVALIFVNVMSWMTSHADPSRNSN